MAWALRALDPETTKQVAQGEFLLGIVGCHARAVRGVDPEARGDRACILAASSNENRTSRALPKINEHIYALHVLASERCESCAFEPYPSRPTRFDERVGRPHWA
jgi:hypothetical protein